MNFLSFPYVSSAHGGRATTLRVELQNRSTVTLRTDYLIFDFERTW